MKQMTIREYESSYGVYNFLFENAAFEKNIFQKFEKLIKIYFNNKEMFFGFWREDGVNITCKQFKKYSKEIPDFFNTFGEIKKLDDYLSIAKVNSKEISFNLLYAIFHYYLDTYLFKSSLNFNSFEKFYSKYMEYTTDDYIVNEITDFLFRYFDSGDFSISFGSQIYNINKVRDIIYDIFIDE